jgi:hypothetical protein
MHHLLIIISILIGSYINYRLMVTTPNADTLLYIKNVELCRSGNGDIPVSAPVSGICLNHFVIIK